MLPIIRLIRRLSRQAGRQVSILIDLRGPKLRIGDLPGGSISLKKGHEVLICKSAFTTNGTVLPVEYPYIYKDVNIGDPVILDDAKFELTITGKERNRLHAKVVSGGLLRQRKGIHFPGVPIRTPALTKKDERDLSFALEAGVDWIALSFVQQRADILRLKKTISRLGYETPVCAKIERRTAVTHIEELVDVSDAVMVCRGDLGVEIPPHEIAGVQKTIVKTALAGSTPVTVGGQLLDSMMEMKRPTSAEAMDVANAVIDGAGGILICGETAIGKHPVLALQTLKRIVRKAEKLVPVL